jgi:enoyl-CoA hydratase/carnithine racemase/predicted DNA-binding antitoxin AbrB/MazE fold protein
MTDKTITSETPVAPLLVNKSGGIARLTLNRPQRRNALSRELVQLLDTALESIAADRETRVVILAAMGPIFCSGHDLTEMTGRAQDEYRALFEHCSQMMLRIRRMPQPVIARVQGMATAAGCQLVAACDLVVAAQDALFATPGVKIGLFCTTPMVPIVRSVPAKVAMEMLLTGEPITAQRAYEIGLVNRVVPADQLDLAIDELARSILASSPLTIQIGKSEFYEQLHLSEADAYARAVDVITRNAMMQEAQEGIAAFLQKRAASWSSQGSPPSQCDALDNGLRDILLPRRRKLMTKQIDAVYENGVLRPLEPLTLRDRERVKVTIAKAEDEDWMDIEFMNSCAAESDPTISLEDVRKAMSKIHGSMADAVSESRGEY